MANIRGLITVNEKDLLEVDSVPSEGGGTPAPLGSMALYNDGSSGKIYLKIGLSDTSWDRVTTDTTSGKREKITLDSFAISQKQVILSKVPLNPEKVLVIPVGGPPQDNGVDYFISGNILGWSGMGMDGILSEDDELVVYY